MAKSAVGVVARIVAKPDSVDIVREGLRSLLQTMRAEACCILYELMQNRSDPMDFTFYEEWTDEASLNAHGASGAPPLHVPEARRAPCRDAGCPPLFLHRPMNNVTAIILAGNAAWSAALRTEGAPSAQQARTLEELGHPVAA